MHIPWYEQSLERCPVCGKGFAPAPSHYWKIPPDRLVCSYSCMRAWEKAEAKRPKRKRRNTIQK